MITQQEVIYDKEGKLVGVKTIGYRNVKSDKPIMVKIQSNEKL